LIDLQSVLKSEPLLGKQIIQKHIKKITLTPGMVDGKKVFHVAVEFELGAGNSGVLLTGSVGEPQLPLGLVAEPEVRSHPQSLSTLASAGAT
jgi:hypothetical protein